MTLTPWLILHPAVLSRDEMELELLSWVSMACPVARKDPVSRGVSRRLSQVTHSELNTLTVRLRCTMPRVGVGLQNQNQDLTLSKLPSSFGNPFFCVWIDSLYNKTIHNMNNVVFEQNNLIFSRHNIFVQTKPDRQTYRRDRKLFCNSGYET